MSISKNAAMRLRKVYSVNDLARESFGDPFCDYNETVLRQGLASSLQKTRKENPESVMITCPQQFVVYEIGEWDDFCGTIHLLPNMRRLFSYEEVLNGN
ncbi:nonstructural protein [Microviridae sp.]|nr:nonstructural protein [Microviridae sp.]